jgi:hypothetical protein
MHKYALIIQMQRSVESSNMYAHAYLSLSDFFYNLAQICYTQVGRQLYMYILIRMLFHYS